MVKIIILFFFIIHYHYVFSQNISKNEFDIHLSVNNPQYFLKYQKIQFNHCNISYPSYIDLTSQDNNFYFHIQTSCSNINYKYILTVNHSNPSWIPKEYFRDKKNILPYSIESIQEYDNPKHGKGIYQFHLEFSKNENKYSSILKDVIHIQIQQYQ